MLRIYLQSAFNSDSYVDDQSLSESNVLSQQDRSNDAMLISLFAVSRYIWCRFVNMNSFIDDRNKDMPLCISSANGKYFVASHTIGSPG